MQVIVEYASVKDMPLERETARSMCKELDDAALDVVNGYIDSKLMDIATIESWLSCECEVYLYNEYDLYPNGDDTYISAIREGNMFNLNECSDEQLFELTTSLYRYDGVTASDLFESLDSRYSVITCDGSAADTWMKLDREYQLIHSHKGLNVYANC